MREFELKFQVPPDRAQAVETALRRGKVARERLRARYFDTPDEALAQAALVLRIRQEGRRWVQAAKGPGDGSFERLESEVPVEDAGTPPDIERHRDHPVHALLEAALTRRQAPLQAVLETDVTRITRMVRTAGTQIEIAFDRGQLRAGGRTHPVLELELELKQGSPTAMVELAQRWCEAHGLWLDPLSKSAQGRRLVRQPAGIPPTRWQPRPAKGNSLLPSLLDAPLQQVLGNARELAAGTGGDEHVHQLRVGIRRLRTTLRELEPLGAWPAAAREEIESPLRPLFSALGAHRNAATLLPSVQSELAQHGSPMQPWQPSLPDLAAAVRDPSVQSALLHAVALVERLREGHEATPRAMRMLARERLHRLHRRVLKEGRQFEALAVPDRHKVRKRLKRLRYLAELVRPLFKGKAVDAYVAALGELQDALGGYQDAVAGRELLERRAAEDPSAWFGAGFLAAREDGLAHDCEQACRHTARRARPFWE